MKIDKSSDMQLDAETRDLIMSFATRVICEAPTYDGFALERVLNLKGADFITFNKLKPRIKSILISEGFIEKDWEWGYFHRLTAKGREAQKEGGPGGYASRLLVEQAADKRRESLDPEFALANKKQVKEPTNSGTYKWIGILKAISTHPLASSIIAGIILLIITVILHSYGLI